MGVRTNGERTPEGGFPHNLKKFAAIRIETISRLAISGLRLLFDRQVTELTGIDIPTGLT